MIHRDKYLDLLISKNGELQNEVKNRRRINRQFTFECDKKNRRTEKGRPLQSAYLSLEFDVIWRGIYYRRHCICKSILG